MSEYNLKRKMRLVVPDSVVVDDCRAEPEHYEDRDGDYIEYIGFNDDEDAVYGEWSIYIEMNDDSEVFLRTMIDGEPYDELTVCVGDGDLGDLINTLAANLQILIEKKVLEEKSQDLAGYGDLEDIKCPKCGSVSQDWENVESHANGNTWKCTCSHCGHEFIVKEESFYKVEKE